MPVHKISSQRTLHHHRVAFRSLGWLRELAVGEGLGLSLLSVRTAHIAIWIWIKADLWRKRESRGVATLLLGCGGRHLLVFFHFEIGSGAIGIVVITGILNLLVVEQVRSAQSELGQPHQLAILVYTDV